MMGNAAMKVSAAIGILAVSMVFGCSSPPPPPPPTVVNLTLITTADDNPTTDNQGAPLAMRVYQLGTAANFMAAEFFPFYNTDTAVLKADMIKREDFLLAPSTTKTETIMPADAVKSIGIFGAYRAIGTATWRVSADIKPNVTTNITVTAGHDGLAIKTETVPSKPAS
jgi:type VI secretion system protein VasD